MVFIRIVPFFWPYLNIKQMCLNGYSLAVEKTEGRQSSRWVQPAL